MEALNGDSVIYTFRNRAKLVRGGESLMTLEASSDKEAFSKLRKYIKIGIWMGWYEDNRRS